MIRFIFLIFLLTQFGIANPISLDSTEYHFPQSQVFWIDSQGVSQPSQEQVMAWDSMPQIQLDQLNLTDKFVWTRFRVEHSPTQELLLEISQPLIKEALLYYKDSLNHWQSVFFGNLIPLDQKQIKNHNHIVILPPAQEYFLRLKSEAVPIPMTLWEKNKFEAAKSTEQIQFGIYLGIMLFVIFTNLLMWVALKKLIFLHYSILVFMYAFFSALSDGYITYLFPHIDINFWYILNPILNQPNGLLYSLFFLEIHRHHPKLFKGSLVLVAYFVSYIFWHPLLSVAVMNVINQLHALVGILVMASLGVFAAKRGNRLGYYYSFSYLVFFAIACIEVIYLRTGSPPHINSLSYVSFAILAEVALLSILLSKRVQWEKERMEEAQYIAHYEAETAKRLNEAKSDFVSMISHELRTPLTSILGFTKIIIKKLDEVIFPQITEANPKTKRSMQQVQDNLGIVISEGERLSSLINDVLDIAKMEAGKVDWEEDQIDFKQVIHRSVASTSSLFENKKVYFRLKVDEDLPPLIGDFDRLMQVMINLISNAVKFTDEGKIACSAQRIENGIEVRVQDSGIGIAPEHHEAVFEKFKQVGEIMYDRPKGTGLGLPISKEIIEHHGGRIWVESELGVGSTFVFFLPTNLEFNEDEKPEKKIALKVKEAIWECDPDHLQKKVLVVDDDECIRQLLRQELEEVGYSVFEATDGMDAISQIKVHRPDIITLDVVMPTLNGFDLAAILKNDPQTKDIPIIIISIVDDQARGIQIGVERYFTKPIDSNKVINAVDELSQS